MTKLVLYSCQFGAVLARTPAGATTQLLRLCPAPDATFEFCCIENYQHWLVAEFDPQPPGIEGATSGCPCVKWTGKRSGMIAFAASRGLRGFTVPLLRKLCHIIESITGQQERACKTELQLIELLLRSIFKDQFSASTLAHAMKIGTASSIPLTSSRPHASGISAGAKMQTRRRMTCATSTMPWQSCGHDMRHMQKLRPGAPQW